MSCSRRSPKGLAPVIFQCSQPANICLTRLEAATSRLEDIATSIDGPGATANGVGGAAVAAPSPSAAAPEQAAPPPEPLPKSVEAFDQIIEEDVGAFVKSSEKVGGLVEEQVC